MMSNLPPGVTDSMIPGNRPEDAEWDRFYAMVGEDCEQAGLDAAQATYLWVTARRGSSGQRKVVQLVVEQGDPGYNGTVIALCDDGTIWHTTAGYGGGWKQVEGPK